MFIVCSWESLSEIEEVWDRQKISYGICNHIFCQNEYHILIGKFDKCDKGH